VGEWRILVKVARRSLSQQLPQVSPGLVTLRPAVGLALAMAGA